MKIIITNNSLSDLDFRIEQISDNEVRLRFTYGGSHIRVATGQSCELRGRKSILLTALPLKEAPVKKEAA